MKRKKIVAIILTAALAASLGLTACGSSGSDSSTDGSAATETTSTSSGSGGTYNLTFSMHTAADSIYGNMIQEMFDGISEDTDGGVNITIYGSATLAAAADVADMVEDGGCDLGWIFTSFYTGQYPLTDVISIPLQDTETCYQATEVLWDLYENYDEMADEWSDYKIIAMYANPVSYIYTDTELSSVSDISGMTLRSTSGAVAEVLADWGADVVSMTPNDIYDGMSKNNIQGFIAEPTMIDDYTLGEVASYEIQIPLYQSTFVIAMNMDVYNSLPDDYKAVIDSYGTREKSLEFASQLDEYVAECQESFVSGGGNLVEVSDEELAELQPAVDEYVASWVSDNSTDDFDAQEFYDFAVAAFESYMEE